MANEHPLKSPRRPRPPMAGRTRRVSRSPRGSRRARRVGLERLGVGPQGSPPTPRRRMHRTRMAAPRDRRRQATWGGVGKALGPGHARAAFLPRSRPRRTGASAPSASRRRCHASSTRRYIPLGVCVGGVLEVDRQTGEVRIGRGQAHSEDCASASGSESACIVAAEAPALAGEHRAHRGRRGPRTFSGR